MPGIFSEGKLNSMHNDYSDIRERITEEPKWWDENAVPRYCKFSPEDMADIYCDEAALVRIECQACHRSFDVAFSFGISQRMQMMMRGVEAAKAEAASLAADIREGTLHFGDPPNIGCCPAGATMNCNDLEVLEYWTQGKPDTPDSMRWGRDPSLEIELSDGAGGSAE